MRVKKWLTYTSIEVGCAKRAPRKKEASLRVHEWKTVTAHGWGTVPVNNVEATVSHPTNDMIFLDIHGGPLDSQRMPFVTSSARRRPTPAMIQDIMVDGVRAIYVFNPVSDRWECRYEELFPVRG